MLYEGHHVRHFEKCRCAFCYEFGHKQCECPMRVWRLSVGERASTSGTGRGRKRGMVGVYHTPLWLQVGTGVDSTVQTMLSVAASAGLRANQQSDYGRQ